MKKKLVTAVTAASMLATIFGSSAFAAARPTPAGPDTTSPKAKYTLVSEDSAKVFQNTTSKAFGFYSDDADKTVADDDVVLMFELFDVGSNNAGTSSLAAADLKAVSNNSNILVSWAYATANGAPAACTALDGGSTLFATTDIVEDVDEGTAGDGDYYLCIAAKTATTAATGTITVSASKVTDAASSWVTMKTVTVTAIGPLASLDLSLTDGYKYVAADGQGVAGALTVVGKDAAGTVLNGATGTITAGVELAGLDEDSNNPTDANDGTIAFLGAVTAVADADSPVNGSKRLYATLDDVCDEGNGDDILSDIGKSYSLKVAAGEIVSNSVSITCTGTGAKAVVKSMAAEVTTWKGKTYNDDGDTSFNIVATIVDENGLPMGNGGVSSNFGTITETAIAALGYANEDSSNVAVGGKATFATLSPANLPSYKKYTYSLKVADSDLGASADVAKTFSFSYTITNPSTITVKMNAAKTVATVTVNFGEDAADASAFLYVENATGTEKTYRKIANASGVATWTIALRKQYVFMYADTDADATLETNLVTVTYK